MTDNLPPNAALVMLVKRDDGGFDIIDKDRTRTMAGTPDQLWAKANELACGSTSLAVRRPMQTATLRKPDGADEQTVHIPSAQKSEPSEDDIAEAFRTVGGYVREMAVEDYGAPVVNAASTLLGVAANKTTKVAKRMSRGAKPHAKYRRRKG
jgi:hypothetical protein